MKKAIMILSACVVLSAVQAKAGCNTYNYQGCSGSQMRQIQHYQFLARNQSHFGLIMDQHEVSSSQESAIRVEIQEKRVERSRLTRRQREAARNADLSHSSFTQTNDGTWVESHSYSELDNRRRNRRD